MMDTSTEDQNSCQINNLPPEKPKVTHSPESSYPPTSTSSPSNKAQLNHHHPRPPDIKSTNTTTYHELARTREARSQRESDEDVDRPRHRSYSPNRSGLVDRRRQPGDPSEPSGFGRERPALGDGETEEDTGTEHRQG